MRTRFVAVRVGVAPVLRTVARSVATVVLRSVRRAWALSLIETVLVAVRAKLNDAVPTVSVRRPTRILSRSVPRQRDGARPAPIFRHVTLTDTRPVRDTRSRDAVLLRLGASEAAAGAGGGGATGGGGGGATGGGGGGGGGGTTTTGGGSGALTTGSSTGAVVAGTSVRFGFLPLPR